MITFLQYVIDAAALGSLYALAALGIGLIFGVMRLINFAHGDFITVAAYALIIPSTSATATMFIGSWPWPAVVAAVVTLVVVLALVSEAIVFRPLRAATPATMMIAAFALSYIIQHIILAVYDSRPKILAFWPALTLHIETGNLRIPQLEVLTILVTFILLVGLHMFLKKTQYGLHMRAAAEDFRMAQMLGVRANRVIATAFALSGVLAAVVSLLFVAQTGVLTWQLGMPLMLFAFIATVIGGIGSLAGAATAGFLVGSGSVFLQIALPVGLRPGRDAFLFALVVLVLIVRPSGLFKAHAARERV